MPWNIEPDPVQPEAAIQWFRSRLPLTQPDFDALQAEAKRRAFFVGGLTALDIVQDTMNSLDDALENGATFAEWKAQIGARLERAWGKPSPHRLVTVFDTNLQSAYGAGRWHAATESERPYWGLEIVLDGRTSAICLALKGVILPADDPFWRSRIPPLHWRCRTALVTFSAEQARARGITSTAPQVNALEGFGDEPRADEWGKSFAKGIATKANVPTKPVPLMDNPRTPADYGRPEEIPSVPTDAKLIPTIRAIGGDLETWKAELRRAWGGSSLTVRDPLGRAVLLDDAFLGHLYKPQSDGIPGDGREHFLTLMPDLIGDPFEIWAMPVRLADGSRVFRLRYIKRYQRTNSRGESKDSDILLVGEFIRNTSVQGYTLVATSSGKYLEKQRSGLLLYGKL
ncbi:MAG: minor capsid protein [Pleurocapsa sp. SU_196_0]|nr:minor capsid protein [Pleurocapsa sp. SU_196_0]